MSRAQPPRGEVARAERDQRGHPLPQNPAPMLETELSFQSPLPCPHNHEEEPLSSRETYIQWESLLQTPRQGPFSCGCCAGRMGPEEGPRFGQGAENVLRERECACLEIAAGFHLPCVRTAARVW